jgi:hypothetical protein
MRKLIAAIVVSLGLASAASAQQVSMPPPAGTIAILCAYNAAPPTLTSGRVGYAQCDSTGKLLLGPSGSTSIGTVNQGNAGTNAQAWWVQIGNGAVGPATVSAQGADGVAGTNLLGIYNQNMLYNGSTLSIQRDIAGSSLTTGFGVAAVGQRASSSANAGIVPVVSTAAEATHVLKASAGNLYSIFAANHTATPGFLLVLDATSAPADGAVTPLECAALPANGNASVSYNPGPASRFSTGITAVLSSGANCFTKTTGTITGFIRGSVQ